MNFLRLLVQCVLQKVVEFNESYQCWKDRWVVESWLFGAPHEAHLAENVSFSVPCRAALNYF